MSRGARAIIDTRALQHNLSVVKKMAPHSKTWAIIKANAYGHGALTVAQALNRADGFGVATLDEALELRASGIENDILLLEGCVNFTQMIEASNNNLHIVIHQTEQLSWLDKLSTRHQVHLWIKIDTGMHRLGFEPGFIHEHISRIQQHPNVKTVGLLSHFACADEPDHSLNKIQLERFAHFNSFNLPLSMANSAAIFKIPEAHQHWIRPGISLYGATPFADISAADLNLKPVMTLTSVVIAERQLAKGESVGYGASWLAPSDRKIATIALGYGDGYPRQAPSGTPTWIDGRIAPLVGKVSMDMITVDVTDIPGSVLNKDIELWGNNLPVDQVAKHIGTIGYELLTRVSARVKRI